VIIFACIAGIYLLIGAALTNWGIQDLEFDRSKDMAAFHLTFAFMTLAWPVVAFVVFAITLKQTIRRNR